jgi:hypothetical protein
MLGNDQNLPTNVFANRMARMGLRRESVPLRDPNLVRALRTYVDARVWRRRAGVVDCGKQWQGLLRYVLSVLIESHHSPLRDPRERIPLLSECSTVSWASRSRERTLSNNLTDGIPERLVTDVWKMRTPFGGSEVSRRS